MTYTLSSPTQKPVQDPTKAHNQDYFNGAAIVTEDGREIPITEAMLQAAFEQFDATGILSCPSYGFAVTH